RVAQGRAAGTLPDEGSPGGPAGDLGGESPRTGARLVVEPAGAVLRSDALRCLAGRRQFLDRAVQRRSGGDRVGALESLDDQPAPVMPLTTGAVKRPEQERRRRNLLIIAGILLLLIVATIFEVGIRAPKIPFASNLIVFALFNLNLVVFLLLLVLLFRNLV